MALCQSADEQTLPCSFPFKVCEHGMGHVQSQWWTSPSCYMCWHCFKWEDVTQLEISSIIFVTDKTLVAKHTWFDKSNKIFSKTITAWLWVCWIDKCGKGKDTDSGHEDRGKGDKSRVKRAGWLLTSYNTGFEELSLEVRDRSGCSARLDSLFSSADKQNFIVTGATWRNFCYCFYCIDVTLSSLNHTDH